MKKLITIFAALLSFSAYATSFVDGQLLTAGQLNGAFAATVQNGAPAHAVTLSSSGLSSALTVPTTGTLATLAGSEALTNKSINTVTGLLLGNGASAVSAYVGSTCTSQFVRALSASGAATCAAVGLTADVTGILPSANGGTANAFFTVSGPLSSAKTFTFPNASATILTTNATVTVGQGGTNSGTALSGSSIMVSNGSAIVQGSAGTTTTLLHGNASGAPTYSAASLTTDVTGVLPIANGGTNAATASGTSLDNITGFASTGFLTRTGSGTYAFQSTTNGVTLANLAQIATNTVLGNSTSGTANISALSVGSCSSSSSALTWTTNSGFGCNTSIVAASAATATSATSATNATNTAITDDTTTNASVYPTWVTTTTGNLPQKVSSTKLVFNPSTGTLSATQVSATTLTGILNKVTVTAPATGSTLTIADGKTATVNNTLTLAGTDSTTITFQGTDTYIGRATTDTLTNKTFNTAAPGNVFKLNGTVITTSTSLVATFTVPTRTVLTSGSGTYTTPANATWLEVELVGGGGGGGGSGTSGGTGGDGTNTTFGTSLLTGNKGVGGANLGGTTSGGTATGGDFNLTGGAGQGADTLLNSYGAFGGTSTFGAPGTGGAPGLGGNAAATNSGSGGGSGGSGGVVAATGSGGSAGGYLRKLVASPLGTYAYVVGAGGSGGSAGTNGSAGGAGGSGVIIITEHYN